MAFVNVAVVPMDTERLLTGQTVLVEGGWITALGPANRIRVPANAVRIDGRNKYLLPGLADMHAHLVDMLASDSALLARLLFQYVASGVTTIRNMDHLSGGPLVSGGDPVLRWRAQAAAGTLVSPRIYTSGQWGPRQYTKWGNAKAGDYRLDSVAAYVAAYKAAGYDFLKPYSERRPVFDSVVTAARRLGLPMAGHIPDPDTTITLAQVLASGSYTSIEHLLGYTRALLRPEPTGPRPVGKWPSTKVRLEDFNPAMLEWEQAQLDLTKIPALAAATRAAGVWNTPTLTVYENRTLSPGDVMFTRPYDCRPGCGTGFTFTPAILEVYRHLVKGLQDAGAGLLLGTDVSPLADQGMHGFAISQELDALVRAGLTPYQALATGTRNVARYFGTLDSTGTVAVGRRADLVLLPGNPLHELSVMREPSGVMLGGRWFVRAALDRRLTEAHAATSGALLDDWVVQTVSMVLALDVHRLTVDQRKGLMTLRAEQVGALKALTDSLGAAAWAPGGVARGLVLARIAGQLGAWRAALTPAQQAFFDPFARIWMRVHAGQGTRVVIPGVMVLGE